MSSYASLPPDPAGVHHLPVLSSEVIAGLQLQPNTLAIDGTVGGGGHTAQLLQAIVPNGRVLALDADPVAIDRVGTRLAEAVAQGRLLLVHANFVEIAPVAVQQGFQLVAGILLDLGLSSFQLETRERGFSFLYEGNLDMRFDPTQGYSAAEIVNEWDERQIADIIYMYGEDRQSRRIARQIVENRPLATTSQLANVVSKAIGRRPGDKIHPATRTFQALRIAVNQELTHLEQTLPQCLTLLQPGGRLAVISFHSLEDRIVKHWMQAEASDFIHEPTHPLGGVARTPRLKMITRKPLEATTEEIAKNPRSRSAKLRIAEKL